MENEKANVTDREISMVRLLDAPVKLVWKVWTDPDHIKNWWGPNGFTNTIAKMDVNKDGEWNFVMHGPDGTDYENKVVFRDIIKYKRIVYEHVNFPRFTATVEFEERGNKTMLNWKMIFENKDEFMTVVKTYGAVEGMEQNIVKLDHYLLQVAAAE